METIIVKKNPTEIKPGDYPEKVTGILIENECFIRDENGQLLAAYFKAPKQIITLGKFISKNTSPTKSSRTRHGVPQLSTVYGPLPRIPIREDYCRFSKKTKQEKKTMVAAFELNKMVAQFYQTHLPENYQKAIERVKKEINNDYRLVNTPWTNLNINMNQIIKFHRDRGNNPDDMSNVLIVKEGCEGGYLACPEYGFTLHQGDGFMVFFYGQKILHGVTPCKFYGGRAFRSSIVNYTLKNLKHCYPFEEELKRLKQVKTNQAIYRKQKNEQLKQYLNGQKKLNYRNSE